MAVLFLAAIVCGLTAKQGKTTVFFQAAIVCRFIAKQGELLTLYVCAYQTYFNFERAHFNTIIFVPMHLLGDKRLII